MTGEITLRGRVLPIGGLKEKVLAAHQSGIRCIIAPKDNEPDLNLIPKNVQRDLKFYWVESMDEVLKIALAPRAENSDSPIDLPTETSSYDLSVQSKSS